VDDLGNLLGRSQGRIVRVMPRKGFTLIELMIGIVILAILTVLALPTFRDFRANTRIRNTADTIVHGVRLAQVEAIKRNENVTLEIDPAVGWTARNVAAAAIATETFNDPSGQMVVELRPAGATKMTFSPLGQFIGPNNPDDGTVAITSVLVSSTAVATPNDLRVTTDPVWGAARVCEPKFVYPADPAGCPAGLP
jgi:type IV fimbrial biogenesis protein FimT